MLKIRTEQMEAMGRKHFENRMLVHLMKFFPDEFDKLSPVQQRQLIRYGIGQSECCGIQSSRDICKYLDLMFTFGKDFQTKHQWAVHVLENEQTGKAASVIDCLFKAAMDNLDDACGLGWNGE